MAAGINQPPDEWEDTGDVWTDIPESEPVASNEPTMLSNAWSAVNKPLVDVTPMTDRGADYIDTPSLDDTPASAGWKGFAAGALQGLGDVISGLTSPLELGLAAASGGSSLAARRGLSGVAKALAATEGVLGAGEAIHGAGEVYGGAREGNLARVGMGIAEAAGGGAGMRSGFQGFNAKPVPKPIPEPKSLVDNVDDWVDTEIDTALATPTKPLPTPEELETIYRGGALEGSTGKSFWTTNADEARGYASMARRPQDRLLHEAQIVKGQYPSNGQTIDGNIPEDWDNIQRVIPNEELERALRSRKDPQTIAAQNGVEDDLTDYGQAAVNEARQFLIKSKPDGGTLHEEWVNALDRKTAVDFANKARAESSKPKPKIKVKLNPITNALEPDLTDELTAKIFNSADTGQPVPDGQRLNPDDEIDLNDVVQGEMFALEPDYKPQSQFSAEGIATGEGNKLADARQNEMPGARVNDTFPVGDNRPLKRGEAKKMSTANQAELPGNIREPKPDRFAPGGRPMKQHPVTKTQQWLGLPRAIQSAFDLSFPLRQGMGLIHTKGWWKAWPDMIKSFGSEATYNGVMDSIAARPNFRGRIIKLKNGREVVEQSLAQRAGLAITDLVNHREEELGSALATQIPGVGKGIKASNRAYNAFANKLRADAFDALIAQNPKAKTDLVLAKQLADFVNNASGRGRLPGKWEGAAAALNNALFSPRLMASRFQMLNPKNYIFTRPEVRKQYLYSALAGAGTWLSLAGLAKAGGAEVVMDPESSDFGKIKIGNTRMDPAAGFQQYIVLASRLAKGGLDKARQSPGRRYSGRAFAPTPEGDVLNFIENKLAPNMRFAAGPWLANKNQQFEVGDQAIRTFTPMFMQDLSEILQENPELAWTLLPGIVGVGSNTYEAGKQSPTLLPPSMWNRKKDISFQQK